MCPRNREPAQHADNRYTDSIENIPPNWHPFHQRMRVHDIDIIDEEHPVKGFSEKHELFHWSVNVHDPNGDSYQDVGRQENRKANIVWCICFLRA